RDFHVTGVQTCALPILLGAAQRDRGAVPRQPAAVAGLPERRCGGGHLHLHPAGQHPDRPRRALHAAHRPREGQGEAAGRGPVTPFAVVLLAAGAGTRMRSSRHKVLHEVAGAPLLEHLLRAVDPLEPRRVVVVVGHLGEQVRERFSARAAGGELVFAEQRELLGTGHALWQAEEQVMGAFAPGERGTVLVLNGDAPLVTSETLRCLLEAQGDAPGMTLLTATVPEPAGLGRIVRAPDGSVERIVEHKDATPE